MMTNQQKQNQRKSNKRKRKHQERVEKRKMEKLYEESRIDPDTCEGQAKGVKEEKDIVKPSWYTYLWSFIV